jgi:putative transposase
MKVHQAYKYELKPNNRQRTNLFKHAGTSRFSYNWGLARRKEEYEQTGKSSNAIQQHKQLNRLKKTDFPWMYEVSKCAPQSALQNLDRAFQNFFRRVKNGEEPGYPKFKKRGIKDSFRLMGCIHLHHKAATLPRIGLIHLKETTEKFKGRILSATVSRDADRWFVSFVVERKRTDPKLVKGPVAGIDVGLKFFAVISDGTYIDNPTCMEKLLRKLQRLHKRLSRKQKSSSNRSKARLRLARLYRRIRNRRRDFLHKLSTILAKTKSEIVIEDLTVSGMIRNRRLARRIADAGWSEFRRMLKYKCEWYGSKLTTAPKFFPSTKRCSRCGNIKDKMSLSERTYWCEVCGLVIDRDLNAALNLVSLATTASLVGSQACGESVRPVKKQAILSEAGSRLAVISSKSYKRCVFF